MSGYQYELYHAIPHVNIKSIKQLKKFSKVPEVIRLEWIPTVSTLRTLFRLGVRVVKLPPKTYKKFLLYLREYTGRRLVLENPTYVPVVGNHKIVVCRTKPYNSKVGRPKQHMRKLTDILTYFRMGLSYRKIEELTDVPKSTVERYIKKYASPEDYKLREKAKKLGVDKL